VWVRRSQHEQPTLYDLLRGVVGQGLRGDQATCLLLCNAAIRWQRDRSCARTAYRDLADCENEPSVLDRGCSPLIAADIYKAASDTFDECVRKRDGS